MGLRHPPTAHPVDHRRHRRRASLVAVVATAALTVGSLPLPTHWQRRWSHDVYPTVQPVLSRTSAHVPVAWLDIVVLGAAGGAVVCIVWARRRRRYGTGAAALALGVGLGWLVFQGLWGWHYQTPTLEARVGANGAGDPERLARRARDVTTHAVARLNALYDEAHAQPWPDAERMRQGLGEALSQAALEAGAAAPPYLPLPKTSLLDGYFRRTGIEGVTNPFGLEVIWHGRLLPVERPAVLAHEWAHLAGFADEADASFVAWMAGVRAGGVYEYAAWLAVLPHLAGALPNETRTELLAALAPGPRADLRAIARRADDRWPALQQVAWQSYDRFLRANRVREGTARYDAVTRLLLMAADESAGRLRTPSSS